MAFASWTLQSWNGQTQEAVLSNGTITITAVVPAEVRTSKAAIINYLAPTVAATNASLSPPVVVDPTTFIGQVVG